MWQLLSAMARPGTQNFRGVIPSPMVGPRSVNLFARLDASVWRLNTAEHRVDRWTSRSRPPSTIVAVIIRPSAPKDRVFVFQLALPVKMSAATTDG